MRKWSKSFCSFGTSMAVLGLVLLAVGFFMGGRPQGLSIGWHNGPVLQRTEIIATGGQSQADSGTMVTVPPVGAENIRSLKINVGAASVEIRTGSEFSMDVYGNPTFTNEVQNGVWVVETNTREGNINLFGTNKRRFVLTIPAGFSFETVGLGVGAGTMQAAGVHAKNASVSVGAGNMTLNDFKADTADIDIGMGTLKLNGALSGRSNIRCGMGTAKLLLDRPADYGYSVSCGMGTVKVDGSSTSGVGNEMTQNASAATFYNIDCGMGTIKVEFNGAGDAAAASDSAPASDAPQFPAPVSVMEGTSSAA